MKSIILNSIKILLFIVLIYIYFSIQNNDFDFEYWSQKEIKEALTVFVAFFIGNQIKI